MLYFIKGRAGSGKTRNLHEKIVKLLKDGKSKPLLVIPEQFSFETERAMLKLLGAKDRKRLDVLSFSRLAYSALKDTEHMNKKHLDEGLRAALMSESLFQLEGRLNVYSSLRNNYTSMTPIVDFCKELKYCSVSADALQEKIDQLEESFLKEKLRDVSLISEAYNALISQSYFDDTDAIDILTEYAISTGYFKNKTVFIDGFRVFSKQEYNCFRVILSQADNVYVTLCEDKKHLPYGPFSYVRDFEMSLRSIASDNSVNVSEELLEQKENVFSSDIFALEKNIYVDNKNEPVESDGSITIAKCVDKLDECKFVATKIRALLRSGEYRCRDIAVIERTNGDYKELLTEELKSHDIPVFEDSRRSLKYEPLFVYINSLLACITEGLTTENIFNYLKSGLSSISLEDVSRLEKYVYVWGISVKQWKNDFTMHPDGFDNSFDEKSEKRLEKLNEIRKRVVGPLLLLKKNCEGVTGDEITRLVYEFIDSQRVQDRLFEMHNSLKNAGFPVEAERQAVCWDVLVSLFDKMATLYKERSISLSRWFEIFVILVDSGEIGEIPQGLDEIKIGSADRIRTDKIKVMFLVGVNNGEFPLVSVKGGLLTDSERARLTDMGLEIRPSYLKSVSEERFITYCALTAASEKLFLSYKTSDAEGGKLYPSEIIDEVEGSVNNVNTIFTASPDYIFELVESDEDAFSLLARNFNRNNEIEITLKEYFKYKDEYKDRIKALERVAGDMHYAFSDAQLSKELFGKDMNLSASRIENYYKCPFAYFVKYGLNAYPLEVAQLDPAKSGTIVHKVMEEILKKYPTSSLVSTGDSQLKTEVEAILSEYIENKMGGADDKSKRFMFLFNHLVDTCMAIIFRLKEEFSSDEFKPSGFEVTIGDDNIPCYKLPLNEGEVAIKGSVDRVDVMKLDDKDYLRIIDYKTGKKDFKLGELFDGLNIQMVLYLMALQKNARHVYGDFVPTGVLYLPSKIGISDYLKKRSPEAKEIESCRIKSGKLSGMILDDQTVIEKMGEGSSKGYYPVKYVKKYGAYKGNTYTLEDFDKLSQVIDSKITEMGNKLHDGKVYAVPSGENNEGSMCKYCSYRGVCGYEYGDEIAEKNSLDHDEAIKRLRGEEDE